MQSAPARFCRQGRLTAETTRTAPMAFCCQKAGRSSVL
ncbi:hypothetical protein GTCCBUS3UF5_12820 [Geobacillus thermoleovorans CCB_US3_UF5]|uniref:Uncharacterized protein n=2 Tax=Geobacillus thermoleovorans group TaxID=1505648 RepID=U2X721_GEOKU|nr:hypothetical protein GTCCBUS3UF5_12820 [Geobacillus thermoleovorans CCB_US3_UF5]GAD14602.1 hypothetical protein GBL_2819 [Geobacillus kaustophilus GBlys]